jgi:pantothenate kinase-related protein Tda10
VVKPDKYENSYQWRIDAERRMGKGMTEAQLRKFVGYFMESLSPEVYYPDLLERKPANLSTVLTIDLDHQLRDAEAF